MSPMQVTDLSFPPEVCQPQAHLLLVITYLADAGTRRARVTNERLAELTHMSPRSVQRHIKSLQDERIVDVLDVNGVRYLELREVAP